MHSLCIHMYVASGTMYVCICILQKGLQPIHYAAQEGREDIVMMLVDDFNVKPDVVNSVCYLYVQCKMSVILCHSINV